MEVLLAGNPNTVPALAVKFCIMLTIKELEAKTFYTEIAIKTINNYTRVDLFLITHLGCPNTYRVRRAMNVKLVTNNIDEAIEMFNSIQGIKI